MEFKSETPISENQTELKIKTPTRVNRLAGLKTESNVDSPGSFFRGAFRPSTENAKSFQEETNNDIIGNNFNAPMNSSRLFSKERFSPISPFRFSNASNSPFKEYCQQLSPLQTRNHTPFSHIKSGVARTPGKNLFGANPPGLTPKLESTDDANTTANGQRLIQKLDFTTLKTLVLFKDVENDNEQLKKEQADLVSQKSTENLKSEHSFGGNTGNSAYFFGLQKSKYNAANPLPVKPNSSNNSSTLIPAPKVADDEHPINPKLFREKTHFQQALKEHSHDVEEESASVSSGLKIIKRIALDSMNSFLLNDANINISSLFEMNKKPQKNQTNAVIPAPAKPNEEQEDLSPISAANNAKKKISCNCKKSKCLKLYCDCFGTDEFCGPDCNCADCHNSKNHAAERKKGRDAILDRNPAAFKSKIKKDAEPADLGQVEGKPRNDKGCNCKKSGCLKKYCECFAAGLKCSEVCKCGSCKNMDPAANQRKLQDLIAVTHSSQERSSKGLTNPFDDEDDFTYLQHKHEKIAAYPGEILTKKIKTVAEVGSFNSFGPNMINEILKRRLASQENPQLLSKYYEETVRLPKTLKDSSFMEEQNVTENPKISSFFNDKMSGEKLKRIPMQKSGLLRPFGNSEQNNTTSKYP